MKLLLDTHAFIWWDSRPTELSPATRSAILDPDNELYLSVVSVWEMVIKWQLGKLSLSLPLERIVADQRTNGLSLLEMTLAHVLGVQTLPGSQKDPFDRVLAAQAISENMILVTADQIFSDYPVRVCW